MDSYVPSINWLDYPDLSTKMTAARLMTANQGIVDYFTAALADEGKGFAPHGTDANYPRPTGWISVEWFGSVEPANAIDGDTWIDTSGGLLDAMVQINIDNNWEVAQTGVPSETDYQFILQGQIPQTGSIEVYGHSGVYGGASNTNRGTDQRIGALLKADALNRSRGGSRLSYHEPDTQMVGGWAHIYRHIAPPPVTGSINPNTFISNRDLVVLWFGENDLAWLGPGATELRPYLNALEACISRSRAAAVYEDTHASVTYPTGTWSAIGNAFAGYVEGSGSNLLFASGGNYHQAASGTISIAVPSNFPGGTVALAFLSGAAGEGANVTFTVDGSSAGSLDTRDQNAHDYGQSNVTGTGRYVTTAVKRFQGLSAGAHTIVATIGAVNTGALFDCWWVEAPEPPVVAVLGGWNTSSAQPNFNFFALASAPYTPNATTLAELNTLSSQVCDTFDPDVIFVDVDPTLNRDPANFANDHTHLSDQGHALIANDVVNAVQGRVRERLAHAKGAGTSGFISNSPVAGRNIIQAQQNDSIPLTLKGRKPGDQLVSLFRLDGVGSYPVMELARNFSSGTDGRIAIANVDGQFVTISEAGDLVFVGDGGKIVLGSTDNVVKVKGTLSATDGTATANLGMFGSLPMLALNGSLLYEASAGNVELHATDTVKFIFDASNIEFGDFGGLPYLTFGGDVNIMQTADTLTVSGGNLAGDTPTAPAHLATKAYVDSGGGGGAVLGSTNTFTAPQIVDLGTTGIPLTLDVHANSDKWISFTEQGTERGFIQEFGNIINIFGTNGLVLSGNASQVIFGGSQINANTLKLTGLGDATAATDAMNRQSADARYLGISSSPYHAPPQLIAPSATGTPAANQTGYVGVWIPCACTLTGIWFFANAANGTVRSSLYNAAGARVANRTTDFTVVANVNQVPFDSTYAATPGFYWIALTFAGATTATTQRTLFVTPSSDVAGPGSGATAVTIIPATVPSTTRYTVAGTY